MPANKNNSRHSSKSNPRVFGYGHKYKCLQISDMDMNTASGVKAAIRRLDFIDNELLYRPRAGNKKAKMKNKKALVITLTGACDDRLKELAKENLFPFIKAISDVSEKEVAQWMDEHMKATKISLTRLKFWRKSVGYSFGGILELIHEQSYGLGQELQTSVGEWNSLNRIYGKIMRGDWMFARENDDTSSDSSSNDVRMVSKSNRKNKKRKQKASTDEDEEEENETTNNSTGNVTHKGALQLERKECESTSNLFQRSRKLAIHPFFCPMGFYGSYLCAQFYIFLEQPGKFEDHPVIESSRKDKYICHEPGPWFQNDIKLLAAGMLHEHKCQKYHALMVSQGAVIQNVYRNRIIGQKSLSVSPLWQYLLCMCLGEHCKLLYRFETESGAYEKNRQLIMNDAAPNSYELGQWDTHYEGKSRLPRSQKQIDESKMKHNPHKQTEYFVRLNPVKVAEFYMENKPDEWEVISSNWTKFRIHDWMHEYLTKFFAGSEQQALDLGILKPEHVQKSDAFKHKKKENDQMLAFV
eukprot:114315_1